MVNFFIFLTDVLLQGRI